MYGTGSDDREEFLGGNPQQPQQQGSQYNFNYYGGATAEPSTANPSVAPEYPTAAATGTPSQFNQFSHSASAGSTANAAAFTTGSAFDNIDISRNNSKFSSGTPFETVHEFVSVSNRVKQPFLKNIIILHLFLEIPKLFGFDYSTHWSSLVSFHLLIICFHPEGNPIRRFLCGRLCPRNLLVKHFPIILES